MTVCGTYETFCADPTRKGPDAAGGYPGPKTVEHWTSSVTGRPVPDTHLAYASYIVGKYGQTRRLPRSTRPCASGWPAAPTAPAAPAASSVWPPGKWTRPPGRRRSVSWPGPRSTRAPYRRARRARISIPRSPWRGLDRSRVRISGLHAAPLPGCTLPPPSGWSRPGRKPVFPALRVTPPTRGRSRPKRDRRAAQRSDAQESNRMTELGQFLRPWVVGHSLASRSRGR